MIYRVLRLINLRCFEALIVPSYNRLACCKRLNRWIIPLWKPAIWVSRVPLELFKPSQRVVRIFRSFSVAVDGRSMSLNILYESGSNPTRINDLQVHRDDGARAMPASKSVPSLHQHVHLDLLSPIAHWSVRKQTTTMRTRGRRVGKKGSSALLNDDWAWGESSYGETGGNIIWVGAGLDQHPTVSQREMWIGEQQLTAANRAGTHDPDDGRYWLVDRSSGRWDPIVIITPTNEKYNQHHQCKSSPLIGFL